ncbi:3-deoxy-D-manno-octulosonic acid transferase [Planctomycetes bacterium K23_9]|uniref:3-deoxy-D-manno-octulosonic acid transferase n=1 Tax=Stieleria marina TaxID=1930275 RepID=A0A517NPM2_9BACT|nr:3-deoxy-D-manno-octulosonic acid transferase [Planctomycetes bacterium K23_9]
MLANLIYSLALFLASPVVAYRIIRHGRYRRGVANKLLGLSPSGAQKIHEAAKLNANSKQCFWLHAVSVGEVNLLPSLVEKLRARSPDTVFAISTSTDTGYDVAVKHFGEDAVFFCPLDFTWAVRRTLRNLKPSKLILAELELWPNLIRIADESQLPIMVVNARLSEKSARGYQKFSKLTRSTFARLTWVGSQDQTCAERFESCGTPAKNIAVTGSIKFDDAPTDRNTPDVASRQQWAGIDPWQRVWMFGSTQEGEEELGLSVYQELKTLHPELRLILVPRHPERFDTVARLVEAHGMKAHRRSTDHSLYDSQWDADTAILIDTIGELPHWWGVCQIATVGGSFGDRGGQNMLEPAGYGCAVSFGPNTKNFAEIAERLIDGHGAVRVADKAELTDFVRRCVSDVPAADSLGRAARQVIDEHCGATDKTVAALIVVSNSHRAAA